MRQRHVMLILFVFLFNLSKKTWRHVPRFHKTLVFVSFINAFYYYLCRNFLLWEFNPKGMNRKWLRAIHILFVTPAITLLSLSSFPSNLSKQILHVMKWTIGSTLIEYFTYRMRIMEYRHGWNVFWSGVIFFILYTYSYLHSKKPVATWILSFVTMFFFIAKFNIPITKRLLKGPVFIIAKILRYS
ncbi:hypothetical protein JCM9157_3049 [Halalkalibacter akibai JCM 9157]|uniref:Uncharacterized protein n=2 Tax=Halalkalibacter akibai TaxID=1411 RepID=W4QUW3_HALA3|nr:hypothetical protein JCM9157_3049 [Halalkalibacter akibai JCM 9157]